MKNSVSPDPTRLAPEGGKRFAQLSICLRVDPEMILKLTLDNGLSYAKRLGQLADELQGCNRSIQLADRWC